MRWLRRRGVDPARPDRDRPESDRPQGDRPERDPVILAVTSPLNRQTAMDVVRRVELLPTGPIVIDLTAIPSFDSDGAEVLLEMQHANPERQLSIVGLRQAAARLMEPPPVQSPAEHRGWVLRRLRNLLVVQPEEGGAALLAGLEDALVAARAETDAAIVVLDLRGVPDLPPAAVDGIAFASSYAAVRGQELLVVNVSAGTAEALRVVGLSATTYVAPEPPLG